MLSDWRRSHSLPAAMDLVDLEDLERREEDFLGMWEKER